MDAINSLLGMMFSSESIKDEILEDNKFMEWLGNYVGMPRNFKRESSNDVFFCFVSNVVNVILTLGNWSTKRQMLLAAHPNITYNIITNMLDLPPNPCIESLSITDSSLNALATLMGPGGFANVLVARMLPFNYVEKVVSCAHQFRNLTPDQLQRLAGRKHCWKPPVVGALSAIINYINWLKIQQLHQEAVTEPIILR